MTKNIYWANSDVTECWVFRGRLYRSYNKAQVERRRFESYKQKYPSWANVIIPPIYKVKWEWEEDNG